MADVEGLVLEMGICRSDHRLGSFDSIGVDRGLHDGSYRPF
jgi:hypothetical protein